MHIRDEFDDRARKGDGLFAIAFALLELADAQQSTATWLKHLGKVTRQPPWAQSKHSVCILAKSLML